MTKKKTNQEKLEYLQSVHKDCDERWNYLKQGLPPGTGMNTIELRINTLIVFMVEWGVITEDQKLDFEIKFAEEIQDQLIRMKKEYEDQIKEAQTPKLIIPSASDAARLTGH